MGARFDILDGGQTAADPSMLLQVVQDLLPCLQVVVVARCLPHTMSGQSAHTRGAGPINR